MIHRLLVKKLSLFLDYFQLWGIPLIAVIGFTSALTVVKAGNSELPKVEPVSIPASSSYAHSVAGAGLVEARNENISIATNVSGVVDNIFVSVGSIIKKGDPLFSIDTRSQKAIVELQKSALLVAQANEKSAQRDFDFINSIKDKRAVSAEESTKRLNALLIAKANTEQASQLLQQSLVELERLTVRSPIDGQVLKINIRPGEFASATIQSNSPMIIGDVSKYWLRVDVDENDAWRIDPKGARAQATLRGNSKLKTDLTFIRFEPYVLPKKSLTGDNSERVDTRVLQVIYEFEPKNLPIFIGQLMDVYIEAKPYE